MFPQISTRCCRECLITSNCDSLRGDLVLACRGGGSMSWLVWESEPGCGAIVCPHSLLLVAAFPWGKVLLGSHLCRGPHKQGEGLPSCLPPQAGGSHPQTAGIQKSVPVLESCQKLPLWSLHVSVLSHGLQGLYFHLSGAW